MSEEPVRGVVKFWRVEKGWGAISSEALPAGFDAWVHFSAIEAEGYRSLAEGQEVDFIFEPAIQDSFRFRVIWVRAVD